MVSVIIPSYNSEKTIERCLDALLNQTYSGEYEIILVDSSNDRTPEIVNSKYPQIKLINLQKKTDPGTARNIGIKESVGDPLLFIDSDCVAYSDWISKMALKHEQTNFDAIGGCVYNGNYVDNNIAWAGYIAEFREFLPVFPEREVEHIPTCNISYKRSVFKNHKFNPLYYPQEDLEFNYKLRESGGKILFCPNIKVMHIHRESFKSFLSHQKIIGEITSKMMKILSLPGSWIVKNRLLPILFIPLIQLVKFFKTLYIFLRYKRQIILKHPLSIIIFAIGLVPWGVGFIKGSCNR